MLFQKVDSISSVVQACLKYFYYSTEADFKSFLLDEPSIGGKYLALNFLALPASTHKIFNIQYYYISNSILVYSKYHELSATCLAFLLSLDYVSVRVTPLCKCSTGKTLLPHYIIVHCIQYLRDSTKNPWKNCYEVHHIKIKKCTFVATVLSQTNN